VYQDSLTGLAGESLKTRAKNDLPRIEFDIGRLLDKIPEERCGLPPCNIDKIIGGFAFASAPP
jgi:hypothetical protein